MNRRMLTAIALAATLATGVHATSVGASPPPTGGGPAELLRYTGDASSATGAALSNGPCDVNGDGYDDLVAGAWFWDKAPTNNIGATYVILGGSEVSGASLADPAAAGAVRIDGPGTANAFTGFAVGCVGDVNGDDLDDIAISHYTAQKTYVVFGAEEFTGLALDTIGDRGFTVVGGENSGNVGYSLAAVGDLNDDDLDDFAVAEVAADTRERNNNGRVWVLAGRDDISDVDLTAPAPGEVLLTVDGAMSEERLGTIASVGDVNDDDVDDFLLGSYTSTPWGSGVAVPGAAYVVFGGTTGEVDAADLGDDGFAIRGPVRQRDRLGISVSGIGDVNDDGLADLLIGADGVNNATTGPRSGGAAVVFGSANTATVLTDPTAASGHSVFTCADDDLTDPGTCTDPVRRGYWIDGAVNSDSTGYSVAGLGDIDGDDVPDLALGAYGFDAPTEEGTLSGAGAVYVVFGDPGAVVQSLGALPESDGYRVDGLDAGDRFGRQVASLGDLDGNGAADWAGGGDFAKRPDTQNGEVAIALMGLLATTTTVEGPDAALAGAEVTHTATVAKSAGAERVISEGTVAFAFAGSPVAGCEAVIVVEGAASCTASHSPGGDQLTATYSGSDLLAASTGGTPLEVAEPNTADSAWVRAAYEDFLERDPADQELADALARLGTGTSRANVARELARSEEWIAKSIRRFYLDTLGREPDAGGLTFWVGRVRSGAWTLEAVGARFYASSEYYTLAGGTDTAWVDALYDAILDRDADPDGLAYWVARTQSRGRDFVARSVYGSPESRRSRVTILYDLLLGRGPDPAGLVYWSERVARTGDLALAVHLVVSSEYGNRAQVRFP